MSISQPFTPNPFTDDPNNTTEQPVKYNIIFHKIIKKHVAYWYDTQFFKLDNLSMHKNT